MYAPPATPKNDIEAISGTYWTIAYRNPRANRIKRVGDLATTWDDASDWARIVGTALPDLEVWIVTTAEAEQVGYVHAEDVGNILSNTGRRVRIVDTGSMSDLDAMIN